MKYITNDCQLVMGIVNITPDSFYRDSALMNEYDILRRVEEHLTEGADIIDIGAQSTQPFSTPISSQEELERIINPLRQVRKHFPSIPISIDTFYSQVAYQCIQEGADIINDVSAGNIDTNMLNMISQYPNIDYVLMHMKGLPSTMQKNPEYNNVLEDIYQFLEEKINILQSKNFYNIVVDVGFGFGKTITHNYTLLQHLLYFKKLQKPLLVGISRKRMITQVLDIRSEEALNGTTILNTIALLKGANVLRVHDVKEAKECIRIVQMYRQQF